VRAKLHGYQDYSAEHIKRHPFCGLFLDMGLGKTLTTLTAIVDMLMLGEISGRILVIAPLEVALKVWPQEICKWDHTRHLTHSLVLGTPQERRAALRREADIHIVNRENVPWLIRTCGKRWPFKTVIVDELSSFKSNQAQRFKALRAVRPRIERLIGLTGTPASNGLLDLWPQMYLLDQGERLGKYITAYRRQYFYPTQQNGHVVYKWALREGAEEAIYSKISDIVISMRAKDHLELPPRTDNIITAELSASERAAYKKLEKDQIIEYEGETITAANAAVLAGKLLQMANGAVYNTAEKWTEIHSAKTDALKNIVEEAQGQPLLVFYQYRHDLARIRAALPEAEELDTRTDCIERWNRGKIPVLLAHPASAGHGLNLQEGGHIIVWFGLTWSLEQYAQANARLDRQGQTEPVIVHHIITAGTIDERVLRVLRGKATLQEALMEAVKAAQNDKKRS
jgi:SNF2 family DNA or RNA helicase